MNSCRITHLPSGTIATSQCRSRENSLAEAKETILSRIQQGETRSVNSKLSSDRKNQVGSGERGDKIRTYRFQDDVVKDHQTEKSATCTKVLAGNFDLLW